MMAGELRDEDNDPRLAFEKSQNACSAEEQPDQRGAEQEIANGI